MATNEFLIFGDSGVDGVNKLSLANYTSDNDRVYGNGYTTKVIRSQLHNKVLQQTSKVSSALAQFLVLNNVSALDSDSVATLAGKLNTVSGNITDGSNTVQTSTKTAHVNYFTGTAGLSTGYLSIKITGLVTATAATVDLGFMEVTITQDDRDHSSATNPASYKFMIKGNMDAGVWYNTQALLLGTSSTSSINVRFTRTATDAYIEIGDTGSSWYYPTVEISHVSSYILAGYNPSFATSIQASLLGTTATDSTISVTPASTSTTSATGVRQTVQSASVDGTTGLPNFLTTSATLNLPIAATATNIVIQASGGATSNDRKGTVIADTSLLLSASVTSFIIATVSSLGVVSFSSTTLAPVYQFGGAPSVTNGQYTFNISEMKMYLGNGATAPQVWAVCIGEAVTSGTAVTSVVSYALNGLYDSGFITPLVTSTTISKNHNIGVDGCENRLIGKCLITDLGYSVGDTTDAFWWAASGSNTKIEPSGNNKTFQITTPATIYMAHKTTYTQTAIGSVSNWAYKFTAQRGW